MILDIIDGKWKAIVLFGIMEQTCRFNELQKSTQCILTNQQRGLEADGLIHREVYAQVPPKVENSLTEFGKTLALVLNELKAWTELYIAENSGK